MARLRLPQFTHTEMCLQLNSALKTSLRKYLRFIVALLFPEFCSAFELVLFLLTKTNKKILCFDVVPRDLRVLVLGLCLGRLWLRGRRGSHIVFSRILSTFKLSRRVLFSLIFIWFWQIVTREENSYTFDCSLHLKNVTVEDAGKYKVTARNDLGESNATISLNFDSDEAPVPQVRMCLLYVW